MINLINIHLSIFLIIANNLPFCIFFQASSSSSPSFSSSSSVTQVKVETFSHFKKREKRSEKDSKMSEKDCELRELQVVSLFIIPPPPSLSKEQPFLSLSKNGPLFSLLEERRSVSSNTNTSIDSYFIFRDKSHSSKTRKQRCLKYYIKLRCLSLFLFLSRKNGSLSWNTSREAKGKRGRK